MNLIHKLCSFTLLNYVLAINARVFLLPPPNAPMIMPLTWTSIQLSWSPSAQDFVRQDVKEYIVYYEAIDNAGWKGKVGWKPWHSFIPNEGVVSGSKSSIVLTGLEEGKSYHFAIRSYNSFSGLSALSQTSEEYIVAFALPYTVYVGICILSICVLVNVVNVVYSSCCTTTRKKNNTINKRGKLTPIITGNEVDAATTGGYDEKR